MVIDANGRVYEGFFMLSYTIGAQMLLNLVIAVLGSSYGAEDAKQKEEAANYVPKPSAPKLLRQLDKRLREELITVNMLFAKIDKSGDAALDCNELRDVFQWTEEQADCVMEFVDIDNSGEITPDELDAAIRANRRGQKPQHAVQHEILQRRPQDLGLGVGVELAVVGQPRH